MQYGTKKAVKWIGLAQQYRFGMKDYAELVTYFALHYLDQLVHIRRSCLIGIDDRQNVFRAQACSVLTHSLL